MRIGTNSDYLTIYSVLNKCLMDPNFSFPWIFSFRIWIWSDVCCLTHWGRVMHICVGILPVIGSDSGLSPGRHQAIIWTNAKILLIWPVETNFSEILFRNSNIFIQEIALERVAPKGRPVCLGLNVSIFGACVHLQYLHCVLPLSTLWSGCVLFHTDIFINVKSLI